MQNLLDEDYFAARGGDTVSPGGDPLLRCVLGARLRRLRTAAGISVRFAGRAIHMSRRGFASLEAGRIGCRAQDVDDLLTLYGVIDTEVRVGFRRLVERADPAGNQRTENEFTVQRWGTFLSLEDAAAVVHCYAPGVLPELVQTAAYAHAVHAVARPGPTAEIQGRVEQLVRRQRLLRRCDPPRVWLVIEEAALRRPFGGIEVWRAQLDYLATAAVRENITVQIVPNHVGGPAISAVPFTLFCFAEQDLRDIVHLHHATGANFLDRPSDLDSYHTIWDRLCVHAIPPEYTHEVIARFSTDWAAIELDRSERR